MRQQRWFYRMLLSYLPVFLVVTSLLLVLLLVSLGLVSKQMAVKVNEAYTNYAMEVVDRTLHSVDQLIYKEIETDSYLKQFFYYAQWDNPYYTIRQPSQKMVDIITTIPIIDSMYLFRIDDKTVLSQNMAAPLDQFGDQDFIRAMMANNFPEGWTSRRTFAEFPGQSNAKSVVSLVKRVPQISGGKGIVVVNIEVGEIANMIAGLSRSDAVYFKLVDKDGNKLNDAAASGGQTAAGAGTGAGAGAGAAKIKALSKVKSAYTGWELSSGLRNGGQFDFVVRLTYVSVLVGLAALLVGIVWIVVATRRNYKPIRSITARIQTYLDEKSGFQPAKLEKDELRFIELTMDRMIEQSNLYSQEQQKYMSLKRQTDLRRLLEGEGAPPEAADAWRASGLGAPPEAYDCVVVALIELDHAYRFHRGYSAQDRQLLKFAVLQAAKETAEAHSREMWAEWMSDLTLGAVYFGSGGGPERLAGTCAHMLEELRAWVAASLPFTVTIALGAAVSDLSGVAASYVTARDALRYKASFGCNRIIDETMRHGRTQGEVYEHLQIIRALARSFLLGEAWRDEMARLFRELHGGMFSNEDFRGLAGYLLYQLGREIMELPDDYQAAWQQMYGPKLGEVLEQSEAFNELQPALERLLEEADAELTVMREGRSKYALIRDIRSYIDEHYGNPDLSLVHLSDAFGVPSKYVSQVFKEECGQNFVDYVADVRLEKAKQLLAETGMRIQEVAAAVGYIHTFSFTRVFKKTIGLTPGEYRKQLE